jgi:hypothetical protein
VKVYNIIRGIRYNAVPGNVFVSSTGASALRTTRPRVHVEADASHACLCAVKTARENACNWVTKCMLPAPAQDYCRRLTTDAITVAFRSVRFASVQDSEDQVVFGKVLRQRKADARARLGGLVKNF